MSTSPKPKPERRSGGVSPATLKTAPAAGPGSGAIADFAYHGGPVVKCPQVYSSFWGPSWSDATHQTRATHLNQFLKDLVASKYMNVLAQYGVGPAGIFVRSSFVASVPSQINEAQIASTIQNAINGGVVPEPPATNNNIVLMIYLDETIAVDEPGLRMCEATSDNAFGFHFNFTTAKGNQFFYAVIPGLNDTCLKNSCSSDAGCSLHLAESQEQRITQVSSHEFAEMVTDPIFKTGWWSPSADENGDICNGQSATITVGPNTWTVQRQYSRTEDIAGRSFCVVDAPNPVPKLAGGPASSVQPVTRLQTMKGLENLLPLPTATLDFKTGQVQLDQQELGRYVSRLTDPVPHENLVPGLPSFLRQLADQLERKSN